MLWRELLSGIHQVLVNVSSQVVQLFLVMTRWNTKDLTGMLLGAQREAKADQWEIVEFPAIMPSGQPLWPEYWKLEELEAVKASTGVQKWNAQYMQNPTSEEGAIIKREWWRSGKRIIYLH